MSHFRLTFATLLACAWLGGGFALMAEHPAASFDQSVKPLLAKHCADCHGAEEPEGDLSLVGLRGDFDDKSELDIWQRVAEQLALRQMPPEGETQPSDEERHRVYAWIAAQTHASGHGLDVAEKLTRPEYGNYVDHDALFDPKNARPHASPPRLWRARPHIYTEMAYDLSRQKHFTQPFTFAAGDSLKDYAAIYAVDQPTTDLLIRNAQAIADYQMVHSIDKDGKLKGSWRTPKEVLVLLDPENKSPTREQFQAMIVRQFQLVHLREPNNEELARYLAFMEKTTAEGGLHRAIKLTLSAIMLSPEGIFRVEQGDGEPDEHGRVMLSPRELAYSIAFALTDERPDNELLKAAAEGRLSTREDVRREVARILDSEKIAKPRIMRFFREYFGYPKAVDVFKDKEEFDQHRADVLVSDTDQLVELIVAEDKNVLRELLTTRRSFVNFNIDRKKGPQKKRPKDRVSLSYNLDKDKWKKDQPLTLLADQRAGILTQPSWLVAHSANTENHPILRGKWVRERLLGGTVPDLPITVDAQLPEDPDKTLRQRMEVTRDSYCWKCHQQMNPLGLTFEMYDHFGRFRETELDKPVDSSGAITRSGGDKLDGDVDNALAMIKRLAESERVEQVFVRHVFRYYLGRNESVADAATLQAAHKAYRESGGSMRALIISLLSSDAFLYRYSTTQ